MQSAESIPVGTALLSGTMELQGHLLSVQVSYCV